MSLKRRYRRLRNEANRRSGSDGLQNCGRNLDDSQAVLQRTCRRFSVSHHLVQVAPLVAVGVDVVAAGAHTHEAARKSTDERSELAESRGRISRRRTRGQKLQPVESLTSGP